MPKILGVETDRNEQARGACPHKTRPPHDGPTMEPAAESAGLPTDATGELGVGSPRGPTRVVGSGQAVGACILIIPRNWDLASFREKEGEGPW